jgi:hypothetical protein
MSLRWMREAWAGFVFIFKKWFIEAADFVRDNWKNTGDMLARGMLKTRGFFDKGFDVEGAIEQLDMMREESDKAWGKTRDQMLNDAEAAVVGSMDRIREEIKGLEDERNTLAREAAKKAAEAAGKETIDGAKKAGEEAGKKGQEGLPDTIPVNVDFNVSGIQAVKAGSAEALARINEFLAGRGGKGVTKDLGEEVKKTSAPSKTLPWKAMPPGFRSPEETVQAFREPFKESGLEDAGLLVVNTAMSGVGQTLDMLFGGAGMGASQPTVVSEIEALGRMGNRAFPRKHFQAAPGFMGATEEFFARGGVARGSPRFMGATEEFFARGGVATPEGFQQTPVATPRPPFMFEGLDAEAWEKALLGMHEGINALVEIEKNKDEFKVVPGAGL